MTRTTILMVATAMAVACSNQASTTPQAEKGSVAVGSARPVAAGDVDITFASEPTTPTTGENAFEVRVTQAGRLVDDAAVSVEFVMPPMPQMKMPEMRTKTELSPAGNGLYRGKGQVMMAGSWNVTVAATRNGQPLGSKTLTVTSK